MKSPLLRIGAALAVVFGGVVVFALTRDPSPLAGLKAPLAVKREVAYGKDPHQTLDVAFEPGKARPLLVMFHPGGWFMGDKSACHAWMAEYARLGYATASVNFRPSPVALFPAAAEDCRDAVRWLRANAAELGIDPKRVGVVGWSSGGHLAALVGLTEPVQAVVAYAGVYDFLLEEHGAFPNAENDEAVVRFLGAPPREKPDLARQASPLHQLDAKDPPMLVFHGELDRRIDVAQARSLAAKSKSLGRKDEIVIIPGGDHGRDVLPPHPDHRRAVREFLDKVLIK